MGTRSTVKFYEDGEFLCGVYQQYDGYIEDGVGDELKTFLKSKKLVNGIGMGQRDSVFNGAGCLAAQFIKKFKEEAGGLYIYREDGEEDFNYKVDILESKEIKLSESSGDHPDYAEVIL